MERLDRARFRVLRPRLRQRALRHITRAGLKGGLALGLVAFALAAGGCDAPRTTSPAEISSDRQQGDDTSTNGAASQLPARDAATTLFAVRGGLVPLFCFDGASTIPGEAGSDEGGCDASIADGENVAIIGAGHATIGARVDLGCGTESTFPARSITPEPQPSAMLATWPADAARSVELAPASFAIADDELAALTKLVADEVAGRYAGPPRLTWTSGIRADVDGDGVADRVVAAHEPSMLIGLVVFFPGAAGSKASSEAKVLSMMQFDRPRVIARSNLDGRPGDEIILDATFVEGIEDQTVASAVSTRVIMWDGGQGVEVGSWGCRMF